jgi:hypothetical protein
VNRRPISAKARAPHSDTKPKNIHTLKNIAGDPAAATRAGVPNIPIPITKLITSMVISN